MDSGHQNEALKKPWLTEVGRIHSTSLISPTALNCHCSGSERILCVPSGDMISHTAYHCSCFPGTPSTGSSKSDSFIYISWLEIQEMVQIGATKKIGWFWFMCVFSCGRPFCINVLLQNGQVWVSIKLSRDGSAPFKIDEPPSARGARAADSPTAGRPSAKARPKPMADGF